MGLESRNMSLCDYEAGSQKFLKEIICDQVPLPAQIRRHYNEWNQEQNDAAIQSFKKNTGIKNE